MVESAILFMVGFLSATLLALLAAPAISRRAARLAKARARLLSPLSETQARADRNGLRAVHAVEMFKMEKKVEAAEWERSLARTDLAREARRSLSHEASMRELRDEARLQDQRFEALETELRATEAESGTKDLALSDITGQRDSALRQFAQARAAIAALEGHIDRNRVEIATLSTQVSALEVELSSARAGKGRFGGESVASLEERLRASEIAREDQTLELARMMRSASERSVALAEAMTAREALEKRLSEGEPVAPIAQPEAASSVEAAPSEPVMDASAKASERETEHRMQNEIDQLKARLEEVSAFSETLSKGDAALRLAIVKLGRDLVRARTMQDDEPVGAAQVVNFLRREPKT